MHRGMIIIGAGECGARAALQLREDGYEGPVTLIGEERHLPYERPPLSKHVVTEQDFCPPLRLVATEETLSSNRIHHIVANAAVAIDPALCTVQLSDGQSLGYDRLLLATGASPRPLALANGAARAFYLRTFDDAERIYRHLKKDAKIAVIGGGFIGLELAASTRRGGAHVTVIEAMPRILMRAVPAEVAAIVSDLHTREGVTILTGIGVDTISERSDGIVVQLADGRSIEVEMLIVGIGSQPITDLAEKAGLAIENGISVDAALQTSAPGIYAAGDCCSFPHPVYGNRRIRLESWRNAQNQAVVAAKNMLGAGLAYSSIPWFWSDQYEHTLYVTGLAEGAASVVERNPAPDSRLVFHLADDGRLLAAAGIGPGNSIAKDIRLAEIIIARGVAVDGGRLQDAGTPMKALLSA